MTETTKQRFMRFDGTGRDHIDLGERPEHELQGSLTIEAWVWIEAHTHEWAGIFSKVFDTNDVESGYGILLDGKGGVYFAIKHVDRGIDYISSGANSVSVKTWTHVAVTYDAKERRVYLNGELKATRPSPGTPLDYDPANELCIGRYKDDNETYNFKGMIAEVRLWSTSRSADGIKQDMRRRLRGDEAGLVGYWPLSEDSGAADRSPTGADGSLHGGAWVDDDSLTIGPSEPSTPPAPTRDYEAELAALTQELAERDAQLAACEDRAKGCAECEEALAERTAEVAALQAKAREGAGGYVLQFNGSDYIDLGTKPAHEVSTSFTIEAWIWVESQSQWAGILSKIFHTGGTQSGYGVLLDGSSGVYGAIKQTDSAVNYQSSGADTITLRSWHHVAFAFDAKEQRLYVDGELKASRASSAGPVDYDPANALYIGRYHDNNESHYFRGMLAEVRLWGEARGAEAIKAGMRTRLRGDEAGLAGYWPLNEGSGQTAGDRSTYTNDGAIHGATWVATPPPLGPSQPDRDYEAELAERDARIAALEEQLKGCDDCRAELAKKTAEVAALQEQLKATPSVPDDLSDIEGVGPKTAEALAKGGITTYAQLAETSVERLKELLKAGGSRLSRSDPSTWPKQAKLAAAGDRAGLKAYQDTLDGGRE